MARTYSLLIQPGNDDYLMNETRRKPTTGTQCPTLFARWPRIFYIDMSGHTKTLIRQSWTTARTPGKVEPFSHEGRSSAMSRNRTHSRERPADYKWMPYRLGHRDSWGGKRPCIKCEIFCFCLSLLDLPPSAGQRERLCEWCAREPRPT